MDTRTELERAIKEHLVKQRKTERVLLRQIESLAGREMAERASELFDYKNHAYGIEGYLQQLKKLKTLLYVGIPEELALESADSGMQTEKIIELYRCNILMPAI